MNFVESVRNLVQFDALYLAPEYEYRLFSSYDRDGGAQDDSGYLEKTAEGYVIASAEGPGMITRIWSDHPQGRIRIILDGTESVHIDCPFRDLFKGRVEPFLEPFVFAPRDENGAHWSYIPIPFEKSCTVLLEPSDRESDAPPGYYQIEMAIYPEGHPVESLRLPLSREERREVQRLGKRFQTVSHPPYGRSSRIHTHQFNKSLAAGESVVLATFSGPAVLRGMQMSWTDEQEINGRALLLKMYWDHEKHPSVWVPVQDFFAAGMRTHLIGNSPRKWNYCYFPMPFASSARVELVNEREDAPITVQVELDVEKEVLLPNPLRTFHASWKRENQTAVKEVEVQAKPFDLLMQVKQNVELLTVKQSKGHLAGLTLIQTPNAEGDLAIFFDVPELSRGLFSCGNYGFFNSSSTLRGNPNLLSAQKQNPNDMVHVTRIMPGTPIPFTRNFFLSLEHGNGNTLRQDISSTVYWYQEDPHEPYSWILPLGARKQRNQKLIQPRIEITREGSIPHVPYEAEALEISVHDGVYEVEDMLPYGPDWSDNQQLRFEGAEIGSSLELKFPAQSYSGYARLECCFTRSPAGGVVDVYYDDQVILKDLDLFHSTPEVRAYRSEVPVYLHASEEAVISIVVSGKQERSRGYVAGIDTLHWLPVVTHAEELEFQGPFILQPGSPESLLFYYQTLDQEQIPLGYALPSNTDPIPATRAIQAQDGIYRFDRLEQEQAIWFFTWNVEAEEAGIYRFEIHPIETQAYRVSPFLLQQDGNQILPQERAILINGIELKGQESVWYDPESNTLLPARFRVPLNEGHNQLSWMLQLRSGLSIQPCLFGVWREGETE
ncbi:MAG: DUF2961 domain-containing protein [bacterium]